MRLQLVTFCVFAALSSTPGFSQVAGSLNSSSPISVPPVTSINVTPAEQRIDAAKHQVKLNPKKASAFADLAAAYLRRMRETGNVKYLDAAEQTFVQGSAIDSSDFTLQKIQIAILLAQHRVAEANGKAMALHRQTPDDVMLHAYLAESFIELGQYEQAEKYAQRMLNLLPNNVPGLLLGAELRRLYGDTDGSLEWLNLAYTETSPTEFAELAWISNRIAELNLAAGKELAAAGILDRTETLFPDYFYTTENLARLRLGQHHPAEAAGLLRRAMQSDTDPNIRYELAAAETAAGQLEQAQTDFAAFRHLMAENEFQSSQARHNLVLLMAQAPALSAEALKVAETQVAMQQDVLTLDAYAWSLYANSRYPMADTTIKKALAVGIQDRLILEHASRIATALHHEREAAHYAELAANLSPSEAPSAPGQTTRNDSSSADIQEHLNTAAVRGGVATQRLLSDSQDVPAFSPVPASLLLPKMTDTDRLIRTIQVRVARNATDAPGFAALGAAYFQQARETGSVDSYQLAERSLTKSLDLISNDFSADAALGTMAEVCMGEHRFADALTYSQKALSLGSGDVSPFAIVGDAYADMGEYDKAGSAYARLTPREMTLSPRAAYARDSRLSYLKFIAGDTPGAIALMRVSVAEGTEAQLPSENLAWLYYELGEYLTQAGDFAAADRAYYTALTIHPGDYRALAALGKLRANHGSTAEAVTLYQRAIAIVPMPVFVAELGDLYTKLGNTADAKKQYQLVEYIGLLGTVNQVLHNRDLAIFYSDHGIKLAEGLRLAQREFDVRHDVYTWDALAWALYKNGKIADAAKASEQALRYGTQDSLFLFHAGMIESAMGGQDQARNYLEKALLINPNFHLLYANEARQKLASFSARAAVGATPSSHVQ